MVLYQTGLLVPGRPMGTFPSDALLQHQKYIGATLKILPPQHKHHAVAEVGLGQGGAESMELGIEMDF